MAGKKGARHKNWELQKHVIECKEAYYNHDGNCKRAARALVMTHQQLGGIWKRLGLKPKGTSWEPIAPLPELQEKMREHGNVARAAREIGISRGRAYNIIGRFGYTR